MAVSNERLVCTVEAYLAMERAAEERHEFLDGYIYKMSGESLAHSRICVNLAGELRAALRGRPCEAHESAQRSVHAGAANHQGAVLLR